MKKISVLIVFSLLFCFCKSKKGGKFDEKLIHRIATENSSLPSQYDMYFFYVQCEKEQISEINVKQLQYMYNDSNTVDESFEDFLKRALHQKQNFINVNDIIDCFYIDKEVMIYYQKVNFSNFIEKYFERDNKSYRLKREFNKKRRSIFYYCFLNNYLGVFDGYGGFYYIMKTSDIY
ncbi:hypothetical protein [Flavobacterium litorale]|uniref:Lipoprotein n=1 Tax=Flavobacterium litorale TaxID=2856519 RepID=A0ABX8V5X8_9FLAO|nr:hypothetical protein [Flavobacterium litorale]QYJ68236.1 hypothetical protein K1I41_12020 [Flavobacterium litorale]